MHKIYFYINYFVPLQRYSNNRMKKRSKITVKFFLNKNLAARGEKGKALYPLYILVTYQRKSTQLKSHFGGYMEDIEFLNTHHRGLVEFEAKTLQKVIEYEADKYGDKFTLAGIGERYHQYATPINNALERYLKEMLEKEMKATLEPMAIVPDYKNPLISSGLLYLAALRLIHDFDQKISPQLKGELEVNNSYFLLFPKLAGVYSFPTVIDWENGSHKKEIIREFSQFNPELTKSILKLIHKVIG